MSIRDDFRPQEERPQLQQELDTYVSVKHLPTKKCQELLSLIQKIGENVHDLLPAERQKIRESLSQIKINLAGKWSRENSEVLQKISKLDQALRQKKVTQSDLDFLNQKLQRLSQITTVSAEDLPLIFEVNHELRNLIVLEKSSEKLQNLYEKNVLPLFEQAKRFIKEHPLHDSVIAAANVGKAAVVGRQAIGILQELGKEIEPNVESGQKVALLPEYGVVFKQATQKAKEESSLVDGIFHLMSPGAVVGAFNIKTKADMKTEAAEPWEAKPFVPMVLVRDFKTELLNNVLQRLTPNAEFNAVLTGEVQLLDLHDGNLGLAPVGVRECERFQEFTLGSETLTLLEVVLKYIDKKIDAHTPIGYKELRRIGGKEMYCKMQTTVGTLPQELQNILNAPWEFVLFDTDRALGEDNLFQIQMSDNKKEHLIPLLSCLLRTEWKNTPLSAETIERLLHSDDRDLRVQSWVRREDAPIYKFLSTKDKEEIYQTILPFLETYSLTEMSQLTGIDRTDTLEGIRGVFLKELESYARDFDNTLWQNLEEKLETRLQKTYDLTSDTPDVKQRRLVIASQLFPRLTLRQQKALHERQACRKDYVQSYQALASYREVGRALIKEMRQYIMRPTTPLNTLRREELVRELQSLESQSNGALIEFKNKLCNECRPTYFNLMKAMYPLLADAYYLNQAAYKEGAGDAVGCSPLEHAISIVLQTYDQDTPQRWLANFLQEKINPSSETA